MLTKNKLLILSRIKLDHSSVHFLKYYLTNQQNKNIVFHCLLSLSKRMIVRLTTDILLRYCWFSHEIFHFLMNSSPLPMAAECCVFVATATEKEANVLSSLLRNFVKSFTAEVWPLLLKIRSPKSVFFHGGEIPNFFPFKFFLIFTSEQSERSSYLQSYMGRPVDIKSALKPLKKIGKMWDKDVWPF